MNNGPWPKAVIDRLVAALDTLVRRLREHDPLAALIAFGSYARREFGGSSDLDLLIVLDEVRRPNGDSGRAAGTAVAESHAGAGEEFRAVRSTIVRLISELEAEWRLPMHLAPLVASLDRVDELGPDLLHNIWADGVVLLRALVRWRDCNRRALRPGRLSVSRLHVALPSIVCG